MADLPPAQSSRPSTSGACPSSNQPLLEPRRLRSSKCWHQPVKRYRRRPAQHSSRCCALIPTLSARRRFPDRYYFPRGPTTRGRRSLACSCRRFCTRTGSCVWLPRAWRLTSGPGFRGAGLLGSRVKRREMGFGQMKRTGSGRSNLSVPLRRLLLARTRATTRVSYTFLVLAR